MMNGCHKTSWRRLLPLLAAFAAGGLATQLVPPYRELAFAPQKSGKPQAVPSSAGSSSPGMTGIDVDMRHLDYVRGVG
jgi:hypothetical protein